MMLPRKSYFYILVFQQIASILGKSGVILRFEQNYFSVREGESFTVPIRKEGQHSNDIVAVLYFAEPGATHDFRGTSYVLLFPPGVFEHRKTFFVEADNIPEGKKTYHLALRILPGSDEAFLGPNATVVINPDEDAFGVLGFHNNVVEIKEGQNPVSVIINRNRGTSGRVSAELRVSKLTRNGEKLTQRFNEYADDLQLNQSAVMFAKGQRQVAFQLIAVDDSEPEDEEVFLIELVPRDGAKVNKTSYQLKVVIAPSDAPIRFLKNGYSFQERNASFEIVITRGQIVDPQTLQARKIGPLGTTIQVPFSVFSTDKNCVADEDFVAMESSVKFEPGVLEQKIRVTIKDDDIPEDNEYFQVKLGTPIGDAMIHGLPNITITIMASDDSNGVLAFAPRYPNETGIVEVVNEDVHNLVKLRVRRVKGTFGSVSVNWTLTRMNSREPADTDLRPTAGIVSFGPGETEKDISIFVVDDADPEKIEKFTVFMKPSSVTGGAKVQAENSSAIIIIEDSDAAHGVVQFADDSEQKIILIQDQHRGLRLLLNRGEGTNGDLIVKFDIELQIANGKVIADMQGILDVHNYHLIMPDCEKSYQFILSISDTAFLPIGSFFRITLHSTVLNPETIFDTSYKPFNSPKLGHKTTATVELSDALLANGELGFSGPSVQYVEEPGSQPVIVDIEVFRNGSSGDVWVDWEVEYRDEALRPGEDFMLPIDRTILIESGSKSAKFSLTIYPDDIPEMDESLILRLSSARPSASQRVSAEKGEVKIIIQANDNPAGAFGIYPPSRELTLKEGIQPVMVTVKRVGGSVASRMVEVFAVDDPSRAEFDGLPNLLNFSEGVTNLSFPLMPKADNIPEMNERFTISIRSFHDQPIDIMPNLANFVVNVPQNDDPHGIFRFLEPAVSLEAREGSQVRTLTVVRSRGTFGSVSLTWIIVFVSNGQNAKRIPPIPSEQFDVSSGILYFQEGEIEKYIRLRVKDDNIPEPLEHYQVVLVNSSSNAKIAKEVAYNTVDLYIPQNDYKIQFAKSKQSGDEGGAPIQIDIFREKVAVECSVKVSTVDETAIAKKDYIPIPEDYVITFRPSEDHKIVTINIIDDTEPEPAETFKLVLSDVTGECSIFGNTELTVRIPPNDESGGVFRFEPPAIYVGQEGVPIKVGVLRERSFFGNVTLSWQLKSPAGCHEFKPPNGTVTFLDGEIIKKFDLFAEADGIPEFNETYIVELVEAVDTYSARVSEYEGRAATVTILENDQPHGLIMFPVEHRELLVHEDFENNEAYKTQVSLNVKRLQGSHGHIRALWEMYSHEIAGKIPPFQDLIMEAPNSFIRRNSLRRPFTLTDVLELTGHSYYTERIPGSRFFSEGFAFSVWVKPSRKALGRTKFLFAKANAQTGHIEFGISILPGQPDEVSVHLGKFQVNANLGKRMNLTDGNWHFIVVNCAEKLESYEKFRKISIYVNGTLVRNSVDRLPEFDIAAPGGSISIGADESGAQPYFGLIQDARLYSRPIQKGEMQELFHLPSSKDIQPVNGYFEFPNSQVSDSVALTTIDDLEEEDREVFAVKLMYVSGGAEILWSDGTAKISVLKSDNANGLFTLESCNPDVNVNEGEPVNCTIKRHRGDAGEVDVNWVLKEIQPDGSEVLANKDFELALGSVKFRSGDRNAFLSLIPFRDGYPEEAERFILLLHPEPTVKDEKNLSTPLSGASIHPDWDRAEIWVNSNDWPNGLFQFCPLSPCPSSEEITLADEMSTIIVKEEIGVVPITIQRSQGTTGKVTVEYRTSDGEAKAQSNYQAAAGLLVFEDGQTSATVNITIFDNDKPEHQKPFYLHLLNPTGGARISTTAGALTIVIAESDYPYGAFNFESSACGSVVEESDGANIVTIPLKVVRTGGSIDSAEVSWNVLDPGKGDVRPRSGIVTFRQGQSMATVLVEVVDDEIPELPEMITFVLTNASRGVVTEGNSCNFTIAANDKPFGEFYIPKHFRPLDVEENSHDVLVTVARRGGLYHRFKVEYRVLLSTDEAPVKYGYARKRARSGRDFQLLDNPIKNPMIFDEGQTENFIRIRIMGDEKPEEDEVFYVVIVAVTPDDPQLSNLMSSPLAISSEKPVISRPESYAAIVIVANDDAHGVLQLSKQLITVSEGREGGYWNVTDFGDFPLKIVRKKGYSGRVGVKFGFENGTALEHQDFVANGGHEVWLDHGEREKALPILIVDDLMPEDSEMFGVYLIPNSTIGGASVDRANSVAVVTIEASDSPNGMFIFKQPARQTIEEPIGNRVLVENIVVQRKRGRSGVVEVHWVATIDGKSASDDVYPVEGKLFFNTGADSATINLYVLADDYPEIDEIVHIKLVEPTNGAELGPTSQLTYELTISGNDNPHGTIAFLHQEYAVGEKQQHETTEIDIQRLGGLFGYLNVSYSVKQLNISEILNYLHQSPAELFDFGGNGYRKITDSRAHRNGHGKYGTNFYGCQLECLEHQLCEAFDIEVSEDPKSDVGKSCHLWISGFSFNKHVDFMQSNDSQYWIKNKHRSEELLYGRWAQGNEMDFASGRFSHLIPPGQVNCSLPINVLVDGIPELNETFRIIIDKVELANWTFPVSMMNYPTISEQNSALITIRQNNNANGKLALSLLSGGNYVEVEETDQAIELVITRHGGSMGSVAVTWEVDEVLSTATSVGTMFSSGDFTGDSATLYFDPGVTVRTFSLSIKDDIIPEERETIVIYLKEATGGAVLAENHTVTVVIRANDNVAGMIGFDVTTFTVDEGDTLPIQISRSHPAKGNVIVPWSVVDKYNNKANMSNINMNEGELHFTEGETKVNITLYILPDRVPEFGENYTLTLFEPKTVGVDRGGGAVINESQSTAIIRVRPSDDPFGIFTLERKYFRYSEEDVRPFFSVQRHRGVFGRVMVTFSIEDTDFKGVEHANENEDFQVFNQTTVVINNGSQFIEVPIFIKNDETAELDEWFSITLNSVELHPDWVAENLEALDTPNKPTINPNMSSGFGIITANDGQFGRLAFLKSSLLLEEDAGTIEIVVYRHLGLFGNISVFIYASGKNAQDSDFKFENQILNFTAGQNSTSVNFTVINDSIPEKSEYVYLTLAAPKPDGVELGPIKTMIIEIRANDGAAGTIGFAMPPGPIRLSEPNEREGALSNVTVFVERTDGRFGDSDVDVRIMELTDYPAKGNIIVSNSTLKFRDGHGRISFWVAVVNDSFPEEEQKFKLVLENPTGGSRLDEGAYELDIVVPPSDHPRGLILMCLSDAESNDCNKELKIDELPGQQHFPVELYREFGTSGNVSVDLITGAQSAKFVRDPNQVFLSPLQLLYGSETVKWFSFEMYGFTYFLMLSLVSNEAIGPTASFHGSGRNSTSDDYYSYEDQTMVNAVAQSTWFRWQGSLVEVQPVLTDNAVSATSFEDQGIHYLVIANFGIPSRMQTKTRIYRVFPDGSLQVHQDIESVGARDVAAFSFGPHLLLATANFADVDGNTVLQLSVHEWSHHAQCFFVASGNTVRTEGARRVLPFTIRDNTYVLVVNYLSNQLQESRSCRLYWYGNSHGQTVMEFKQGIEAPEAIDAQFASLNGLDHFLAIAMAKVADGNNMNASEVSETSGDSIEIFKWHTAGERFVPIQTISAARIRQLSFHKAPNGHSLELITAEEAGPSRIFRWSQPLGKFVIAGSGPSACAMSPSVIPQLSTQKPLEVVVATNCDGIRSVVYAINRIDQSGSDFAPIGITFTFLNNQRGPLSTMVTVLDDEEPEESESFVVQLRNPIGDCELAQNMSSASITIRPNDDAYGIIEFMENDIVEAEETVGMFNVVFLNVIRRGGSFGFVRLRWTVSPPDGGYRDISPLSGDVIFEPGQEKAQIQLTIHDDTESELDESAFVSLEAISSDSVPAKIGEKKKVEIVISANDSPHGVIGWESVLVTAHEEPRDYRKTLFITREQGNEGTLDIGYQVTIPKSSNAQEIIKSIKATYNISGASWATPGADFVPVIDGQVQLSSGQKRVPIGITILADDEPEEAEEFILNLTSVQLRKGDIRRGAPPSIRRSLQTALVIIPSNDDANGVVEFDISQLPTSVSVYEIMGRDGSFELPLIRHTGSAGRVVVHWESRPGTASSSDYAPLMGTIIFESAQRTASLIMAVLDDDIPENDETFDVLLTQIVGGGRLGICNSIKVVIKRNDSPFGVFAFDLAQPMLDAIITPHEFDVTNLFSNFSLILAEPIRDYDPASQLTVRVIRQHGTEGTVKVRWVLGSNATDDFLPPHSGVLTFEPGEVVKEVCLRAKADQELEGTETFILSLLPNDTLAELAPSATDVVVIIRADSGAGGLIRVKPGFEFLVVSEPFGNDSSREGLAEIMLIRENGMYGEVVVDWQISPAAGRGRFLAAEGQAVFEDKSDEARIVIYVRNDDIPQTLETYELRLLSAVASAASLDHSHATVQISILASDWPYGLFRIQGESVVHVKEDSKSISVVVERLYGVQGAVDVTYTTSDGTASFNDFKPIAGHIPFSAGQARATLEIPIYDDDLPEPNEQFFVNLTSIILVSPDNNDLNMTEIELSNGKTATVDLQPALDPDHSSVNVIITSNDNAAGIVGFASSVVTVIEESRKVELMVVRHPGAYGRIIVPYKTKNESADWTDYVEMNGEIVMEDRQENATITITITDDTMPEEAEAFQVFLLQPSGGASVDRTRSTCRVVIAKSDFRNGRFAFSGATRLNVPNPEEDLDFVTYIERTAGTLSKQQLFWKLYGPNNNSLEARNQRDICILPKCAYEGEFKWNDKEFGPKEVNYKILGHHGKSEPEKQYWIRIDGVRSIPHVESEDGEIDPNYDSLSIIIEKNGDPNGIFSFAPESIPLRSFFEPENEKLPVTFRIERGVNNMGRVTAKWVIRGNIDQDQPDVSPMTGDVVFEDRQTSAGFEIFIEPDDVPEMAEHFYIDLIGSSGGAEVSKDNVSAHFVIQANDNPYGVFSVHSELQKVTVRRSDMSRSLMLNFSRSAGTFGRTKLTYSLRHISDPGRASGLLPRTESVEFAEGHAWMTEAILLSRGPTFFLHPDSYFEIDLIRVELLDSNQDVGIEGPVISAEANSTRLITTPEAANSIVSFESPISSVDEFSGMAKIVVKRKGSYGNVRVYWSQDMSKEGQFSPGRMDPIEGSLEINHGIDYGVIWVKPSDKPQPCRVYKVQFIGEHPESYVDGGAVFGQNEDDRITEIERYGLVMISPESQKFKVSEDAGRIEIKVDRLYGSLSPVMVYYSIIPGSAKPGLDYQAQSSGSLLIANSQTSGTIAVTIKQDAEPEPSEFFFVNLTRVAKLPTEVASDQQPLSPRISNVANSSRITISANSDPFGVLTLSVEKEKNSESDQFANVIISRLVGVTGEIAVTVRTASTSEPWLIELENSPVWQELSARKPHASALTESDYRKLDKVIIMRPGQRQAKVSIRLLEDDLAEGDESFFVYLSRPVGGARLAGEEEGRWFTKVTIEQNDQWNGYIGFDGEQKPKIDEDHHPNVTIALRRFQAMFGNVSVSWQAVETQQTPATVTLSEKLVRTGGSIECPAFSNLCFFVLSMLDDDVPEIGWEFALKLTSAGPGATLAPNATQLVVRVSNSDDPYGLIRFSSNSMFKPISILASSVALKIERSRGTDRTVRVDVNTYQILREEKGKGGEVILPAVEKIDYYKISETVVFRPGVTLAEVVIPLGGHMTPSRALPRMFQVILTNPTSGARVDDKFNVANVTIVKPEELTSWQAVAQALVADNADVEASLKLVEDNALSSSLNGAQLNRLESVLLSASSQPLTSDARNAAFKTLCHLANPKRNDAVVGRNTLSQILDKMVLNGLQYTTNCSLSGGKQFQPYHPVKLPDCPNFKFQAFSASPSEIQKRTKELGFTFRSSQGDWVKLPDELVDKAATVSMAGPESGIFDSSKPSCANFAFVEYSSPIWFERPSGNHEMIGSKVMTVSVPNEEKLWRRGENFGNLENAVEFRVHMPNHAIAPKHSACFYLETSSSAADHAWHDKVCQVTNDLTSSSDDFVQCSCRHFSSYAAAIPKRNGYSAYFVPVLIASSLLLAATLICHHVRSPNALFSASLNMHVIFASFATLLIYASDILLSRSHLLVLTTISPDSDHYKCTIVGVLLHYFFLAQFSSMFAQALNLWRIFVLNDEHTRRKYVWFFILSWGTPAIIIAGFYAGAFHVFKQFYSSSTRAEAAIYGNVGNFGDICFVIDPIAASLGATLPAVLFLLATIALFVHAFQLRAQWHAYDDIYRGRYNLSEVNLLLPWLAMTAFACLWGGVHLAFNEIWWQSLFLVFTVSSSLYVFFLYGLSRTPFFDRLCCRQCSETDGSIASDRLVGLRNSVPLPAPNVHRMIGAGKEFTGFSNLGLGGSSNSSSKSSIVQSDQRRGISNKGAILSDEHISTDESSSIGAGDLIYGFDEPHHQFSNSPIAQIHSSFVVQRQSTSTHNMPPGTSVMPDIHL